jgi:hypothetical protein
MLNTYTLNIYTLNIHMLKIALLFLTVENIKNVEIWEKYIENNRDKINIYCHTKHQNKVTIKWQKDNFTKYNVGTNWGHLTNAYVSLIHDAFLNAENCKFVYLSESCIPVRPFDEFYDYVINNDKSNSKVLSYAEIYDIPKHKALLNFKLSNLSKGYIKDNIYKHSGWFVLSRFHAYILLTSDNILKYNNVIAGDEYMLSIIKNNKYIVNKIITFTDWNRREENMELLTLIQKETDKDKIKTLIHQRKETWKHPKTFSDDDLLEKYDSIYNSGSFFCRKVNELNNDTKNIIMTKIS